MSFTYAVKTGSLKDFLHKIKTKELGVPDKVNRPYLKSIGYKSSNDVPIIRVFKSIGFITKNNIPTQRFREFRTEKSGQIMASSIKEAYSELFKIYPEPYKQSRDDLENFFAKNKPSLKKFTLGLYTDTFKTLCEFADFESNEIYIPENNLSEKTDDTSSEKSYSYSPNEVNINININLPVTEDITVYNKILRSIKEILLNLES